MTTFRTTRPLKLRLGAARVAFVTTILALAACDTQKPSSTQPANAQADKFVVILLKPGSETWIESVALEHLGNPDLAVSAAVRLVRLAEQSPACIPESLTDDIIRKLRVMRLNDTYWAVGLADEDDQQQLRAPALITTDGEIERLANGVEEEVLVLHASDDADVFPHLAIQPDSVDMITDKVLTAIVLVEGQPVRFTLGRAGGFPYVSLVLTAEGDAAEVARYVWEPYELSFVGPAIQPLPNPPGGKAEIDLEASKRLEPMGGEIPEPEEIKTLPETPEEPIIQPPDDEWLPA